MQTNRLFYIVVAACATGWPASAQSAGSSYQPPRPSEQQVAVLEYEWHDATRDRDVPIKIYYPASAKEISPVIIFSHGLGGSREGYEYLGRHWAGCGYVSVHIQHIGSDDSVWKNVPRSEIRAKMVEAAHDPSNALNRSKDISFVIDQLIRLNNSADSPLHERLSTKGFGVAGHSFGAWTAMAEAGETFGETNISVRDPRIVAAIALSPPVPRLAGFNKITIPVFQMTGTLDNSPIGEATASIAGYPSTK